MEALLTRAMAFAVSAHAGQTRKGTSIPYIVHPMEACAIASELTEDEAVRAAAVLHDVLEDVPEITYDQLLQAFGRPTAELVRAVSEEKRRARPARETWEVRKRETIDSLTGASRAVQIIALSDKLSNLRSLARDHRRQGAAMWSRFNESDPARHAWYYRSVLSRLTALRQTPAMEEAQGILAELFGKIG